MKRILQGIFFFLLIIIATASCELFDDCKTCSLVSYVDGEYDNETGGQLFCGDELEEIKNEPAVIRGDVQTRWECY